MAHTTISAAFAIPQLLRGTARISPLRSALLRLKYSALCSCTMNGTMKSKKKTDHLERTANNFRQEVISPAKVCGITNESETVKRLRLAVTNKDFTFKAGQWVDFFIPEVAVVGGFSICSSPGLLEQDGVLELAVKHNVHPPAHWIHTQCSLDSEVALRVGGNFFFDPQPADSPVNLVLIAGGVGINPLFSILLHVADFHRNQESEKNGYKMGTVKLYYSAKNTNELLFKNNIFGLMNEFPGKITCSFHVTQQSSQICEELQPYITEGRISEKELEKHVSKDTLWYICGPPPMIESISKLLENFGVPTDCIYFEKWW
ncbi:oxidoreductase NAD-binding domain-containing protein 1 isoform X2 [Chelonoidis abingdonii]|uniref:oxidoreductase NAD-binding domain-containing protein 1 isoform X2 n=2 Tax=Chelonoidis abingdonii TaxID=106734 RepID=UPI0013F25D60|nr:oxidoreductase NAD-binding domain-containing protein 1 isoform X2 [Chelonoidis abingdonii]XP_032657026.1 oxidoreductase NAD-binding domain-containing protein 1 isoform X2 [Chelonoidis abingdonii]XP_032657027.1 oxidoreductase NAD-binding domain-containing protein 1 isoform X2 [Chelonoidis abingdonii]XP_032657028.1 oxidoreductase NAD-binding domain-containing protein 1 isoform X2 [Chelonoidis abingdonii]XP_032657029.1 oxidoreductase NAD-binding domain-containing protein 1 isoform X2 [Chelonoid